MNKVIVTGANGFVGSWLIKELISRGIQVTAVVKDEQEKISHITDELVHIVYCELSELNTLTCKISDRDFDAFYHLAWMGSTGSLRADYALQLTNAKYTVDATLAAAELKCRKFIGAGTLAQIDSIQYAAVDGSAPNAVSNYGLAKTAAQYMSKAECAKLGIDHIWIYLSNLYGIGDYSNNFIRSSILRFLQGHRASFTSGEQLYDFLFISDVAQGLYLAGEKGKPFFSYYLGSTSPRKLKEYILDIRNEIDEKAPFYLGEVPYYGICHGHDVFDCSKFIEHTGYQPNVSFAEGIKRTVLWIRSNMDV